MDDREFWVEMRRALLLIANGTSDPATRRGMLQVVALLEKKYDIPKLRVIRRKKATG